MTFKRLYNLLFCLLILPFPIFAQSTIPVTGGIGGGLLLPASSNMKGYIYSIHDYPLSNSSYSLYGKIRIGLLSPMRLIGDLSYNALSENATLPVQTNRGIINSEYTNSLSILSLGIGAEYTLFPTPLIKPYIGGYVSMNFINGNAKYKNDIIPEANLNSTNRIGMSIGIGSVIEIPTLPFSFEVEAKYNFSNLIGKEFNNMGYDYSGFGGIPQTKTYNLNDAKNPNDSKDYNRSINYLTIALLINFRIL